MVNLYAERMHSEQAFAIWSLDDISELGTDAIDISSIALTSTSAIKGKASYSYGTTKNLAYAICSSASPTTNYAKDSLTPLVYGSNHSIKLFEVSNDLINGSPKTPSIIFPASGMFNDDGRYKTYTFEFWMRITPSLEQNSPVGPFRIFGPIAKNSNNVFYDGLYIDGSYLKLKIENYSGSYFIDDWGRPMLIQIQMSENFAALSLNGEEVIRLNYDSLAILLPPVKDGSSNSNDWVGFYTSTIDRIKSFEIDAVSMYSYLVSSDITKKRFVYGQGINYPGDFVKKYNGLAIFFDHSVARYDSNHNFPQYTKWDNGIFDGVDVINNEIQFPQYSYPKIVTSDTSKNIFASNEAIQTSNKYGIGINNVKFFTMIPDSGYSSVESYIYFNNLNLLRDVTQGVFGIFEVNESSTTNEQILIKISDPQTLDNLTISRTGLSINYNYTIDGITTSNFASAQTAQINTPFMVGIDLFSCVNLYPKLAKFLNNFQHLEMYVGGDNRKIADSNKASSTFNGKIYSINFSTANNMVFKYNTYQDNVNYTFSWSSLFSNGILWKNTSILTYNGGSSTLDLRDVASTYSLRPKQNFENFEFDIATTGYWQISIPLSNFAKNISGTNTLSMIQLNIGYPKPINIGTIGPDTNNKFTNRYDNIIPYVGFRNYQTNYNGYDLATSLIANNNKFDYPFAENPVVTSTTLYPGANSSTSPAFGGKINVFDSSVISFIKGTGAIPIDTTSIIIYLEFYSRGIKSNPLRLKYMELTSKSDDDTSTIATSSGVGIIPNKISSNTNAFSISKKYLPHLYLSSNSGIKMIGDYHTTSTNASKLSIPINIQNSPEFVIGSLQFVMKANQSIYTYNSPIDSGSIIDYSTIDQSYKFLSIPKNLTTNIDFYIHSTSSSTQNSGKIVARESYLSSGTLKSAPATGLTFYVGGTQVTNPTVYPHQWIFIEIKITPSVSNIIDNSRFIDIVYRNDGPIQIDNISVYQPFKITVTNYNSWGSYTTWSSVKGTTNTWQITYFTQSQQLQSLTGDTIYKTFVGTNSIVFDSNVNIFKPKSYSYLLYSNTLPTSKQYIPT